ncbi:MAG: hypothetical protein JW940_27690, partial [Polyangiaceae bacterium]|nr:hypothetical protein [Polyangiaceae bacterium]
RASANSISCVPSAPLIPREHRRSLVNAYAGPGSLVATDCVFEETAGQAITAFGYGSGSMSVAVSNCTFANNTATYGAALSLDGVTAWVENSVLYGNSGNTIYNYNRNPSIISSTFFNNTDTNPGSVVRSINGTVTLLSSIVWGNSADPFDGSVSADYCDIQDGLMGTTNFSADPLFASTDPGSIDLSLQNGSPCIDRAPNDSSIPATDCLGHSRYDDPATPNWNATAIDIGAYEWQGP